MFRLHLFNLLVCCKVCLMVQCVKLEDLINQYKPLSTLKANLFLWSVHPSETGQRLEVDWYKVLQVSHMPRQADCC